MLAAECCTLYRVMSLLCCPCGRKLLRYLKTPMGLSLIATPTLAMSYLQQAMPLRQHDSMQHPAFYLSLCLVELIISTAKPHAG